MGHDLDASRAFTTIALFNMLQMPFALLPLGIVNYLQSRVSVNRIVSYLQCNELQGHVNHNMVCAAVGDSAIKITNADIGWVLDVSSTERDTSARSTLMSEGVKMQSQGASKDQSGNEQDGATVNPLHSPETVVSRAQHTLTNINVHIKHGSLVAIVGAVGSGKSSLLSTILGEVTYSAILYTIFRPN